MLNNKLDNWEGNISFGILISSALMGLVDIKPPVGSREAGELHENTLNCDDDGEDEERREDLVREELMGEPHWIHFSCHVEFRKALLEQF